MSVKIYVPRRVTEAVFYIVLLHLAIGLWDLRILVALLEIYWEILKTIIDFAVTHWKWLWS